MQTAGSPAQPETPAVHLAHAASGAVVAAAVNCRRTCQAAGAADAPAPDIAQPAGPALATQTVHLKRAAWTGHHTAHHHAVVQADWRFVTIRSPEAHMLVAPAAGKPVGMFAAQVSSLIAHQRQTAARIE